MIKNYLQQNANIDLTEHMQTQLKIYCDFLLQENEKYNLTAITDVEQVYIKHFADCMLGSAAISKNAVFRLQPTR